MLLRVGHDGSFLHIPHEGIRGFWMNELTLSLSVAGFRFVELNTFGGPTLIEYLILNIEYWGREGRA